MKTIRFFGFALIITLFDVTSLFAQDFAEEDFVGTWDLIESSGEFVYKYDRKYMFGCPVEIEFYTEDKHVEERESLGVARISTSDQHTYTIGIQDYFLYITANGDLRLHIQYGGGHYIVRYIVLELSQDQMELMTYDKKGRVTYRRKGSTSVRGLRPEDDVSDSYYNLKGEKISTPTKGINLIQHNGVTTKVLSK